jgi:regulator of protease activity HflC (stomatin/prohibitin superfamily)
LFAIVPFIDNVASWLDQRIQTTEINAEKALSKDTVPVNIDAVVFLADPRSPARRTGNYKLPPGDHPGRAKGSSINNSVNQFLARVFSPR